MGAIRVILADNHAVVRLGVRSLLEQAGDIEIIAEAADGIQALALVEAHHPDVLVTDIAMPGLTGLELASRVARDCPPTRVLILSMHREKEYATKASHPGPPVTCSKTPRPPNARRLSVPWLGARAT